MERLNIPEYKRITMVQIIEMHSSKIITEQITTDNVEFYKRLLKIQKCDAKGYEYEHSLRIIKQLDDTVISIKKQ